MKTIKFDGAQKIDPTFYQSLVGSLIHLTKTRPGIAYSVGAVPCFIECSFIMQQKKEYSSTSRGQKTSGCNMQYATNEKSSLIGYMDSDRAGTLDD